MSLVIEHKRSLVSVLGVSLLYVVVGSAASSSIVLARAYEVSAPTVNIATYGDDVIMTGKAGTYVQEEIDQVIFVPPAPPESDAANNTTAIMGESTAVLSPQATGYNYTTSTVNGVTKVDITDANGWLATFTKGAVTATVRGQVRSFSEPATTSAKVSHNVWVRLLPAPFNGNVDTDWLNNQLSNTSPDVITMAMQYLDGAGTMQTSTGFTYAGNADYGPLLPDGSREEGSDFNDYLGINVTYGDFIDAPEATQHNSLDCSGYMRMLWGYRLGLKMAYGSDPSGTLLPRRAVQMYESAPGALIIPRTNPASQLSLLRPGDLVFFDVSTNDGADVDHVGMFLGIDSQGNYRFISSRKTANGPTMGDSGGKSTLNGSGIYASGFAAARRL